MSKLIEELSTIPEWNAIGKIMKEKFAELTTEELDNLDTDVITNILDGYHNDVITLVARLVMEKVKEEWRQEGKDEFNRFVKEVTKDWSEEDKVKYLNLKKGLIIQTLMTWLKPVKNTRLFTPIHLGHTKHGQLKVVTNQLQHIIRQWKKKTFKKCPLKKLQIRIALCFYG